MRATRPAASSIGNASGRASRTTSHLGGARPASTGGFSLIEVLIAMAILLVGGVSILSVFALAGAHAVARQIEGQLPSLRDEAVSIAQDAVNTAPEGKAPADIDPSDPKKSPEKGLTARPDFTVAVKFDKSPNGDSTWVARIRVLYRGHEMAQGMLPPVFLTRQFHVPRGPR